MDENTSFTGRIGCFFLLIGIVLLVIFLASDAAHQPAYTYLCFSVVGLLFGFVLWAQGKPPPGASERFRSVRKMRESSKKGKKKGER